MYGNHRSWQLLGIVLVIALSGCAPGYHAHQRGCIPYCYCPEAPLPYTTYCCSHCPTPIASQCRQQYAEIRADSVEGTASVVEDSVGYDGKNPAVPEPLQGDP